MSIPQIVKTKTWESHIGKVYEAYCLCCNLNLISSTNFHCGHVISRKNNGTNTIENLRPICSQCNLSMNSTNMIDFCKLYFPNSILLNNNDVKKNDDIINYLQNSTVNNESINNYNENNCNDDLYNINNDDMEELESNYFSCDENEFDQENEFDHDNEYDNKIELDSKAYNKNTKEKTNKLSCIEATKLYLSMMNEKHYITLDNNIVYIYNCENGL
jgi:hypothetical protein